MKKSFKELVTDTSSKTIYFYIILVTITLMIVEQLYTLSKLVYKYNFSFYTGSLLKKICNLAYVEYETERFQVDKDVEKMKIKKKQHYDDILFIVTTITMFIITFSLLTIFSKNYMQYFIGEDSRDIDTIIEDYMEMGIINKFLYFIHFVSSLYVAYIMPSFILINYANINLFELKFSYNTAVFILCIGCAMIYMKNIDISYFSLIMIVMVYYVMYLYWSDRKPVSQTVSSEKGNILLKYIYDIFGLKSEVSILLILLCFLLMGYLILTILYNIRSRGPNIDTSNIFSDGTIDMTILNNLVLHPFILLFVVVLFVNVTEKYNIYINEYILQNPQELYKTNISYINNIFNKMIDNNYATTSKDSVCVNIANAVHMALYSTIFTISKSDVFTQIIPRFEYEVNCENNGKIIYNEIEEYLPNTYFENITLFIVDKKSNKCNNIDDNKLKKFITISTDDTINIGKKIKIAIRNILDKKVYNDENKSIKYSTEYNHNNIISFIDTTKNIGDIGDENDKIVDEIEQCYNRYIVKIREYTGKMLKKLKTCSGSNVELIEKYTDDYSQNIKISYVNKCAKTINSLFVEVNNVLTDRLVVKTEDPKLTQFVINNYNIFQDKYGTYRNSDFIKINKNKQDSEKYDGIEDLTDIVEDIKLKINTTPNENCKFQSLTINEYDNKNAIFKDFDKTDGVLLDNNLWFFPSKKHVEIKSLLYDLKSGLSEYIGMEYTDDLLYIDKKLYVQEHVTEIERFLQNDIVIMKSNIEKKNNIIYTGVVCNQDEIDKFNKQFDIINKNYVDKMKKYDKIPQDSESLTINDEEYSKRILSESQETSFIVYVIFLIYMLIYYMLYKIR